ncbi:hypothetical protein GGI20_000057 [Coemansia sp. BCRC 34301]|nr:hypothetical protein GGI20_000057 [Coemansia sp. BCRC 34301]
MFAFKKSKGKRNIRKKDDDKDGVATDESLGAADIVRRTANGEPKAATPKTASTTPGLSFGVENSAEAIVTKRLHLGYELGSTNSEGSPHEREYSKEYMAALASETYRHNVIPPVEASVPYPFASEGIPDAHEIYLAKQLRRQRQAAGIANAEMDIDDTDSDSNTSGTAIRHSGGQDYISLSDGLVSSRTRSSQAATHLDDGAIVEGEDEFDAVIVNKSERAEFNRTSRRAKEESIEQAQEEDEPSDWEKEQLRSAGFAPAQPQQPKSDRTRSQGMPRDEGGFEYDDTLLSFLLGQERNQLALEQDQLQATQAELCATKDTLDTIVKSIAETQAQWSHFSSLARSV